MIDLQHRIAAARDLPELLGALASGLAPLLAVRDRVSLALLEPDGEWMRVLRILPVGESHNESLPRVRIDGTPVGRVVREGVGVVVEDVRTDPNITFGHASHDRVRSTVSAPLWIGGRVVGVLNAGSRVVGTCTDDMLRQLTDVAAAIGAAVYAAERSFARAQIATPSAPSEPVRGLVGSSPPFQALLGAARRAAKSDADVLIVGETGVGKTAIARAMHAWSGRGAGPFVTVHLGDLTPTLIESELFGHERGAFTGAAVSRVGRFESAQGGTIFLDEVGETPLPIQSKLLRVIQDRAFERVGGGRTVEADVRVIAATSRDLRDAVRRGEFREDLYYRLNVVPLVAPPLRARQDDLPALVESILGRIQTSDGRARRLSAQAWHRVSGYDWPGNIRELESVLRRAAIFEDDDELTLVGFPDGASTGTELAAPVQEPWPTLEEHERRYIERVLDAKAGVIEGGGGAAHLLGLPPSTLRSRMKKLGISARASRSSKRGAE